MRPRDPWRQKLDAQIDRRRQRGDGFGRDVVPILAAKQMRRENRRFGRTQTEAEPVAASLEPDPAPEPEANSSSPSPWSAPRRISRRQAPIYGFVAIALVAAFAAPIAVHNLDIVNLRMPATAVASSSPSVIRVVDAATRTSSSSIGFCPPQYRRGGGGVSCVTDGDSGVEAGEPWRLVASSGGVDAPEIGSPECSAERAAGERAKSRLRSLMSGGYSMSGWRTDRFDRRLVQITLADGRDAGSVLLDEGLAQPWPNSGNPWCR